MGCSGSCGCQGGGGYGWFDDHTILKILQLYICFFNGDILLSSFFPLGSSLFFQGVIALSAEECPENLEPSFLSRLLPYCRLKNRLEESNITLQFHVLIVWQLFSISLNDLVNLKLAHLISWNILEICNGHIYSVFENIICDGKDSFYSIIS